jgi:hypothetical protein
LPFGSLAEAESWQPTAKRGIRNNNTNRFITSSL